MERKASTKKQANLLQELVGTVCRCGARKQKRNTFCYRDYKRLPLAMQRALYRRIGEGYEQAYADAVEFLDVAETARRAVPA